MLTDWVAPGPLPSAGPCHGLLLAQLPLPAPLGSSALLLLPPLLNVLFDGKHLGN